MAGLRLYRRLGEVGFMQQENIPCRHHWIIDSAQGPMSKGVCQLCGAKREFRNSHYGLDGWMEQARQYRFGKPSTPPEP